MLVVQHVEEASLSKGVMNSSETASRNPAMSEVIMLERDIRELATTPHRFPVPHLLEVIRRAKARALP